MRRISIAVCRIDELLPDTGKACALGSNGGECLVVLHQGRYYALGSLCPHQNAPLNGSLAAGNALTCRRHGFRFDLKTGDCLTASGYGLPVYQVDVNEAHVYVSYWEYD